MPATPRTLIALALGAAALVGPSPTASGATSGTCGGTVFRDLDGDGVRTEALERNGRSDDVERGFGGVGVMVTTAGGAEHSTRTSGNGRWSVDLSERDYPIRIEFELPDGVAAARTGADGGALVQYAAVPGECDGRRTGGLGVYEVERFCAERPEIAVPCYVTADLPGHDEMTAIKGLSSGAIDNARTDAASIEDWLKPSGRTIATLGEIATVYGQAAKRDGTIFASGFTKRHTRSVSSLNPSGNPTMIFRIPDGGAAETFAVVDRNAENPHGSPTSFDDWDDLDAMGAVYTTGLGDLEISPDESTLYTVDLGRRELVELDADTAEIIDRHRIDGAALRRSDCNVSQQNRFGDLRAFGLGWSADERLLVGVVCSAESTVAAGQPVVEKGDPGPGEGDPGQLTGHVYAFARGSFTEVLEWPLAADRGETQNNGLLSNDAMWHPWVSAYPFDAEHGVVSYPQPAITDLEVDADGNLIIALGDRWGHQTGPSTVAPSWDGGVRAIAETVSAGDLQRACRRGQRWVIEGSPNCDGGFGNGWEFFDGDSYGWHAETAFGSVARLPGRSEVVVTQMDPIPEDDTWRSGGLAWHSTESGAYDSGVRLYDGRSADPDHTFEKASGLGDLAILCGGPLVQVGGSVWRDLDADGVRDPADPPIAGASIELRDDTGAVLSVVISDDAGRYAFDDRNVADPLDSGAEYVVTLAARNYEPDRGVLAGLGQYTGLVPTAIDAGARDDLDSDASIAPVATLYAGLPSIPLVAGDDPATDAHEQPVANSYDFGLRDSFDLSVTTEIGDTTRNAGLVSFVVEVRNEGSVDSGAFTLRSTLPPETSLRSRGTSPLVETSVDADSVTFSYPADQSIAAGDSLRIEVDLQVNDPTVESVSNRVEIMADSGNDEDSTPGRWLDEDDEDEAIVRLFGLTGSVWADVDTEDDERTEEGVDSVVVVVLDDAGERVGGTTTDESGRFLFHAFPAGSYRLAIPASEFEPGRPLHRYDTAFDAESGSVADMLADDGFVRSKPIVLDGRDGTGSEPGRIELGLGRRPPRPMMDIIVPAVLLPISLLFVGALVVDRRRHVGGFVTRSRGN